MIGKYFKKTGEIEISGNVNEFNSLSKKLQIDKSKVELEYKKLNPFPDTKNLECLQIKHLPSHSLVKISVEGNALLIEGSTEKLAILSDNLSVSEEELKNYHIHIEYYDDHFYLSPESNPLIVQYI